MQRLTISSSFLIFAIRSSQVAVVKPRTKANKIITYNDKHPNNFIKYLIQNTYPVSPQVAKAHRVLQGLWPSLDLLKSLFDLWKLGHLLNFSTSALVHWYQSVPVKRDLSWCLPYVLLPTYSPIRMLAIECWFGYVELHKNAFV
jgi:hypothetical protein